MKTSATIFSIIFLFTTINLFGNHSFYSTTTHYANENISSMKADMYYLLNDAIELFSNGDYTEARTSLNNYLAIFPEDYTALYFAGLNQLQLGNYASAIKKLNTTKQHLNGNMQDDAQYYYAVCLMAIDDHNGAKKEFELLANDKKSQYNKVAGDILASL